MSVTSGVGAIGYVLQPIDYLLSRTICRRTYGKETKAKPTIRAHLHITLTGDTLNRDSHHLAIAKVLENSARVRSIHSSLRTVTPSTRRRNAVVVY